MSEAADLGQKKESKRREKDRSHHSTDHQDRHGREREERWGPTGGSDRGSLFKTPLLSPSHNIHRWFTASLGCIYFAVASRDPGRFFHSLRRARRRLSRVRRHSHRAVRFRPPPPSSHHGLARHHPHGHRRRRQWNRPRALPLSSADVHPDLEEGVGGAVLGGAVRGDAAQLHDVGAVRAPRGAPAQHARHHHQRHRHGHRAHLHRPLPRLLPRRRPPPRPPPPRRRGRLRRRRRRPRPQPRPHPRTPLHDRRHPLRPLRHRHVRRPPLRHENGDPDQERGVHAPFPVPGVTGQRHLLDCLRPHPLRPLHHYSERAGSDVRGGAADPVRHLLQVDAADHRGAQAQGRPGRHDRGRRRLLRRRQEQPLLRRRHQRPLLAHAALFTSPASQSLRRHGHDEAFMTTSKLECYSVTTLAKPSQRDITTCLSN